ncbi:MAG: Holliday junction branch migration protein RuvA [Candidatus Pacebacteria bacterium]|nr:Holliday junction branch migration protein RuvA [Candidatus Paceibacterota bacterium]
MIRQLRGTLLESGELEVVIDVGGVGYLVHTPDAAFFAIGGEARLHTHLAVRENALDLYGFAETESLRVFELLLTLPKIGPKSALQILAQADVSLLREAVNKNDAGYLSKLSGIGKKSAEKIVVGLRDKLGTADNDAATSEIPHAADTIDALIALGYTPQDARRVFIEITATNTSLSSSAEVIKLALRYLNK